MVGMGDKQIKVDPEDHEVVEQKPLIKLTVGVKSTTPKLMPEIVTLLYPE